ncbi:MAG: hypothetical protein ACOYY2_13325 [Actinomycetota bacterium]
MIGWLVAAFVVVIVLASIGAVVAWKALGGRKLARQARLLLEEQTAATGAHAAVIQWRRILDNAVDLTRRALRAARDADAPTADLEELLARLVATATALDRELALLALEPDAGRVDYALRTDIGVRADRTVQIAAELRRAAMGSMGSGNAEQISELASSTDLSTRALAAALEELGRPRR